MGLDFSAPRARHRHAARELSRGHCTHWPPAAARRGHCMRARLHGGGEGGGGERAFPIWTGGGRTDDLNSFSGRQQLSRRARRRSGRARFYIENNSHLANGLSNGRPTKSQPAECR